MLVVLAVLWGAVLVSWLRSRHDRRGVNSISSFAHHLHVLERTSPARGNTFDGSPAVPAGGLSARIAASSPVDLATVRRRRRNVLLVLSGVAVGALLLVPFLGSLAVLTLVVSVGLLVGYVVLLVRTQRLAAERRAKVRYLHPMNGRATGEPLSVPRQSAI